MNNDNVTIKGNLQTLLTDCENQENALRQRGDVCWDCYDVSNWASMVVSILEIAGELGIELKVEGIDDEEQN